LPEVEELIDMGFAVGVIGISGDVGAVRSGIS